MREAIADGRACVAPLADPIEQLRAIARVHLDRMGRDRSLAVVFQVELRQSTKFMERFSVDAAARVPRHHPRHHRRRAGVGRVPQGDQRHARRQAVLRRARRDGDQLDPQHAQVLAGRRGGRDRRLFVDGVGGGAGLRGAAADQRRRGTASEVPRSRRPRRRRHGRADRGALRQRRPARAAARRHARRGARRARAREAAEAGSVLHARRRGARHDRRLRRGPRRRLATPTGSSKPIVERLDAKRR